MHGGKESLSGQRLSKEHSRRSEEDCFSDPVESRGQKTLNKNSNYIYFLFIFTHTEHAFVFIQIS